MRFSHGGGLQLHHAGVDFRRAKAQGLIKPVDQNVDVVVVRYHTDGETLRFVRHLVLPRHTVGENDFSSDKAKGEPMVPAGAHKHIVVDGIGHLQAVQLHRLLKKQIGILLRAVAFDRTTWTHHARRRHPPSPWA